MIANRSACKGWLGFLRSAAGLYQEAHLVRWSVSQMLLLAYDFAARGFMPALMT